jgi:arylsulfatase A-like enzyme
VNRPNIVLILMDDLGWRDLSCYGTTFYETPHLDRLAAEGMCFSDDYAACPVCSPTRASILTGKYPATVGVTDWIDWTGRMHPARGKLIDVPYVDHLPLEEIALPEVLRAAGYHT